MNPFRSSYQAMDDDYLDQGLIISIHVFVTCNIEICKICEAGPEAHAINLHSCLLQQKQLEPKILPRNLIDNPDCFKHTLNSKCECLSQQENIHVLKCTWTPAVLKVYLLR